MSQDFEIRRGGRGLEDIGFYCIRGRRHFLGIRKADMSVRLAFVRTMERDKSVAK